MFGLRIAIVLAALSLVLSGCARPPKHLDVDASAASLSHSYVPVNHSLSDLARFNFTELTGRTIRVSSIEDIKLRDHEVVLTFDDGPSPKITTAILDALDLYRVKATFLPVGRMVDRHPETLRDVAQRGHSVGTHTHDHENLANESTNDALEKIQWGYASVQKALAPIGMKPAPFFRFPYLSDTQVLRTNLADDRMVVLDVDIDSKDYKKSTPQEVLERTLRRVEARGRGIILFHDIQGRTAKMLPEFLAELSARGYQIVHLTPSNRGIFDRALVTASVD